MSSNFIFGISLTASFLAGVLALFAPCCITFLLPSYLGTIFKESKKVVFYTLIFALGLAFILIPIALGFRFFIFFFDAYHKWVYYLGGVFLILMGITTLRPFIHLPQIFHTQLKLGKDADTFSVFALGLMSGLTSSCCAPVLLAAVTLTTLSPTIIQAAIVSGAYVLGIVFPLVVISIFYEKVTDKISGKNRKKIYETLKSIGASIFIISGAAIVILAFFNKIQMYQMEGYSKPFRFFIFEIAKRFQNPVVDITTFVTILVISYLLIRKK